MERGGKGEEKTVSEWIDGPSGELISTMLTLVWAIAGICGGEIGEGVRVCGGRGAGRE